MLFLDMSWPGVRVRTFSLCVVIGLFCVVDAVPAQDGMLALLGVGANDAGVDGEPTSDGHASGAVSIPSPGAAAPGTDDGAWLECGPVVIHGVYLGRHSHVLVRTDGRDFIFGIGGGGETLLGRLAGHIPPKYEFADPSTPADPCVIRYRLAWDGTIDDVRARVAAVHAATTPPPYYMTGKNSNTYAHYLVHAAGLRVVPYVAERDGRPIYCDDANGTAAFLRGRIRRAPFDTPGWDRFDPRTYGATVQGR